MIQKEVSSTLGSPDRATLLTSMIATIMPMRQTSCTVSLPFFSAVFIGYALVQTIWKASPSVTGCSEMP